jgi:hypothetical protein
MVHYCPHCRQLIWRSHERPAAALKCPCCFEEIAVPDAFAAEEPPPLIFDQRPRTAARARGEALAKR